MRHLISIAFLALCISVNAQITHTGASNYQLNQKVPKTTTINGHALTGNISLKDTAVVWDDTVRLTDVEYRIFALKTPTGNIVFKKGLSTKNGYYEERWIKGTGNSYTLTFPIAWKNVGLFVYDDILNTYYKLKISQGDNGIIYYLITKLP